MKKLYYLSLVLLSYFIVSCSGMQKLESDKFETSTYELEPFDAISVAEGIEVTLIQSNSHRAEASSNFMEYLVVDVEDGTLMIYFDEPTFSTFKKNKTTVEVWASDIKEFRASSAGSLTVSGRFKSPEQSIFVSSSGNVEYDIKSNIVNIEVSSSGDYKGTVDVNELYATATSSGDIKMKGNAITANLQALSSGDIKAEDLTADIVKATVSSSGDVYISVNKELNAEVSSSGDLHYKPNGTIDMQINKSSGGSVQEIKSIL